MRWILGLVWIAFIAYALLLAPGQSPGSDPIFQELITMQSKEPWLLTVFSWLGIFPAVYACMLLRTSVKARGARVPAWPFVLLSFGLGAFALLPYYVWSSSANRTSGYASLHFGRQRESGIARVAAHKLTHVVLLLLTLGTACYALMQGHPDVYMDAFKHSSFVHIMTIDFVLLTLLSVIAIYRDARSSRRSPAWAVAGIIPIVGLLLYLLTLRKDRA
ncbi:PLDc N-terminal domain-containing protein [Paenibacillus amylolyticus]|nr:PLDc N-terminal domain-containing protein [Paenibacillus amylolyticus]WFR61765.1 PLDc N-terminal domain-containing protein [Paenibacillus amylolyticus]